MKKPPTRKPARAKAKWPRTCAECNRLSRILAGQDNHIADLTAKLNTANACVAKQIERIATLESTVAADKGILDHAVRRLNEEKDRAATLERERDEKQHTIDRLCRANEALRGEIETLNGQLLVKESSAKTNSSPPLKVGDICHTDDEKRRVPVGARVRRGSCLYTLIGTYDGNTEVMRADDDSDTYTGMPGDWTILSLPPAPQAEQPAQPRTGVVVDVEAGDRWQRPVHPTIKYMHILQVRGDKYRPVGGGCCGNWMDNSEAYRRSDITPAEARAAIEAWGHEWREVPPPRTRTLWAAEYKSCITTLYANESQARNTAVSAVKFYPLTFTEPTQ